MKRKSSIKTSLVAIAVAFFLLTGCEKEQFIQSSDLPREISTYILTHFPDNTILQAVIEKDGLTKTYNIILSENISLEFNRKKEIIDIDSETKLPDSVIPAKSPICYD